MSTNYLHVSQSYRSFSITSSDLPSWYHYSSAYHSVSGPQGCIWPQHCSIHMVFRGWGNHVGNLSASSSVSKRVKTDMVGLSSASTESCNSAGSKTKQIFLKITEVAGWPDGEGELSSPAVTNCRSDPKAAIELLGRMQRSPDKLLQSNA